VSQPITVPEEAQAPRRASVVGHDPEAAERHKRALAARQRALSERCRHDWEYVLGDERGRRCIQNILVLCNPDTPLEGMDDTRLREAIGQRRVGLWIRNEVRALDPSLIERMAYEHALPPEMVPESP
jgi:hypothetical protein